tara:strand:- start:4197 stop:4814 length:618 start_codon:yes stop_codon:yes gene_type:complete
MKTFNELKKQLDEITYKQDKKNHISSTKMKNTEIAYHAEKKGSKKIRVFVKPKSARDFEELGVFKDMNTAKKSAEQFVKLMGEDIEEGVSLLKQMVEKATPNTITEECLKERQLNVKANKALPDADVKKIKQLTNRNDHNGAVLHLAKKLGMKVHIKGMEHIIGLHKALGNMPKGLVDIRKHIYDSLMRVSQELYTNHDDIYNSF